MLMHYTVCSLKWMVYHYYINNITNTNTYLVTDTDTNANTNTKTKTQTNTNTNNIDTNTIPIQYQSITNANTSSKGRNVRCCAPLIPVVLALQGLHQNQIHPKKQNVLWQVNWTGTSDLISKLDIKLFEGRLVTWKIGKLVTWLML